MHPMRLYVVKQLYTSGVHCIRSEVAWLLVLPLTLGQSCYICKVTASLWVSKSLSEKGVELMMDPDSTSSSGVERFQCTRDPSFYPTTGG